MGFRLLPTLVLAGALTAVAQERSGIDPAALDRALRPQDDLYGHANATWLARTPIPSERVTWDGFAEVAERVDVAALAIVKEVLDNPRGAARRQIADMYRSITDESGIAARGAGPMRAQLDRIDRVDSASRLAEETGILSATGTGGPFDGAMVSDPADPSRLTVRITQGGILLPERDLYFRSDARAVDMRLRYTDYLTTLFRLLGRPEAAREAHAVLALETELARAHGDIADGSDPALRYTLGELARAIPGFDWPAWGRPQGLTGSVVLAQPTFFAAFAALVPATPFETWRAWLRARYVTAVSPYVSEGFGMARFEFFGRYLTGQQTPRPRWRRGVSMIGGYLPDAIGRLYVERHFPPSSKQRVEAIADRLKMAFREALQASDWLSPAAKREALRKLSRLRIHVGYPEAWRDYRDFVVRPDDLLGNILRGQHFENQQQVARAAGREDPRFWPVAAHSVNALHNPARNEIVLPAGLLQPPFFDAAADEAINFGAIGGVIGHELAHAFDSRGRQFDASGATRDWWTEADEQAFLVLANRLVEQASGWPAPDGESIDGTRTVGENAADLAGLAVAYRAYRASTAGERAPVIDGLSGEQRFFLGWAQAWRATMRPEYVRQARLTDPHAPAVFRVNGIVRHIDGFHEAFGVREGDRMYLAPGERVRVW